MIASFDTFWAAYPRRVAKAEARKAWAKLNPSPELLAEILAALDWQRASEQWQKDGGQYTPYPASYIRGERWTDEPPAPTYAAGHTVREARAALEAMHGVDSSRTRAAHGDLYSLGAGDTRESGPRYLRRVR